LAALANLCDFVVAADVPTTIFSTPLESFTRVAVATWAPDETYASNIYVTNGGNIYFGGGGPTASSGGPTGTGAGIADGDATWDYVAADPAAPSAWYYFRSGTTYNSAAYRDDYDGSNDYTYDFEYLSADSGRRIFSWLRTSLLALAGIQGFQRVYRAQIIGGGTGVTGAGMYATFSDGSVDEASWAGGFEFEHLFSLQKCESIQLEFWWTAATRKHLTALNLLVGVKSDYARLPSGQRG
jgi:hypothetical protein